jgi:hypothetical protein
MRLELLIRRSRHFLGDRALRAVGWADIPESSVRVGRCPAARQQSRRLRQRSRQSFSWKLRCDRPHLAGMARVRSGQAPAWPLSSDRSARRGSGVKHDFACTFTRHSPPVLVALRSQSCLRLEGRARTLSGPSPDLSPARIPAPSARCDPDPAGCCSRTARSPAERRHPDTDAPARAPRP